MSKPSLENPQTDAQLKDITIIIGSVAYDDDENPYAVSVSYRGDLEGSIETFIRRISLNPQLVELTPMKSFDPSEEE